MKVLKKLFKFLIVLIVILVVAYLFISSQLKPKYNGELEIANLKEKVTVFYDENGVPHIQANNQEDAYRVFGYVHAQDRLWQMEVIRRISAGRLSEIFGKEMIRTDKFFSSLGIEEASKETIAGLDKNSQAYKLTEAYLEGINSFIEKGATPLEFYLIGLEKEKYTIKDVYNVFGYMAFSFAAAHKTDPLLNEIKEKYGAKYIKELGVSAKETTIIKNARKPEIKAQFSSEISHIMNNLPVSNFIGSNAWVLGADRTKNGKVIFANDPHIAFSQPSVWYQNHIKTPDYEMYGFNLGLSPFPLLGHNKKYAYGLTMFENDDVDFYLEQNNPKNNLEYKTPEGFMSYKVLEKRIKVKGEKDTVYKVRVSKHGPIMNDVIEQIEDDRPIAMKWIYTKTQNQLLDVGYEMSHANSLAEFKKGVSKISAPGLNVMYGDAKDNIGWFAAAKLYKYRDSLNTKIYLDGASGKDEQICFYDFEENPQAINPDWGYVYSANNQPDSVRGKLYPGYYLPEDRAKRITNLIGEKKDFTKQDVAKMLYDTKSSVVVDIIKIFSKELEIKKLSNLEKEGYDVLVKWNGDYLKEAKAPTIYNRFIYEFLKNTFSDEMGKKGFLQFMDGTPFYKKMIAFQMNKKESVWWDDVTTDNVKEDKKEIIQKSFSKAISFLSNQLGENVNEWKWEKVLSVEHGHPIGMAGGILRTIFNVGPFKTNGGNEVINNHIFKLDSTGIYNVTAGPSSRRVIDFSDVENSLAIIPTGQSGNRFSQFYKDQAKKYLKGGFIKMKLNKAEIENSENKLVFLPELKKE